MIAPGAFWSFRKSIIKNLIRETSRVAFAFVKLISETTSVQTLLDVSCLLIKFLSSLSL